LARWFLLVSVLFGVGCRSATPEAYGDAQPLVEQAIADLASRRPLEEEQIEVVQVEATEFDDASLGVPEPGQMYAQVITPGYIIVLQADDKLYEYHAGDDRVVLASEVHAVDQGGQGAFEVRGPVTTAGDTSVVVGGRTVSLTNKTVLEETVEVGQVVRVTGQITRGGGWVADEIHKIDEIIPDTDATRP
jgi:hypothetical protein